MEPHYGSQAESAAGHTKDDQYSTERKIHILRSFFRTVVGPIFPDIFIANPYGVDQSTGGNYICTFVCMLCYHFVENVYNRQCLLQFTFNDRNDRVQGATHPIGTSSERDIYLLGRLQVLCSSTVTTSTFCHHFAFCAKSLNEVWCIWFHFIVQFSKSKVVDIVLNVTCFITNVPFRYAIFVSFQEHHASDVESNNK